VTSTTRPATDIGVRSSRTPAPRTSGTHHWAFRSIRGTGPRRPGDNTGTESPVLHERVMDQR